MYFDCASCFGDPKGVISTSTVIGNILGGGGSWVSLGLFGGGGGGLFQQESIDIWYQYQLREFEAVSPDRRWLPSLFPVATALH